MLLTAEQLRTSAQLKTADVPLPDRGGEARIRQWLGTDNDDFEEFQRLRPDGDIHLVRAASVAASVIDESGKRVFDVSADAQWLADNWTSNDINAVWDEIRKLNKKGDAGLASAEKN